MWHVTNKKKGVTERWSNKKEDDFLRGVLRTYWTDVEPKDIEARWVDEGQSLEDVDPIDWPYENVQFTQEMADNWLKANPMKPAPYSVGQTYIKFIPPVV